MPRSTLSTEERFWAKVDKSDPSGCWLWQAYRNRYGYGQFSVPEENAELPAHRYAYQLLRGPVSPVLQIDHLCRVHACVNPDHLEPVTVQENVRRSLPYRATANACKWGHEFTPENTHIKHGKRGDERVCLTCRRRHSANGRAKRNG